MFKQQRIMLLAPLSGDLWPPAVENGWLCPVFCCGAVSGDLSWGRVGQFNLTESPPSREQDLGSLQV